MLIIATCLGMNNTSNVSHDNNYTFKASHGKNWAVVITKSS